MTKPIFVLSLLVLVISNVVAQQFKISVPNPKSIVILDGGLGIVNKFSNTKPLAFGGGISYTVENKKGKSYIFGVNYTSLTESRKTLPTSPVLFYYQKIITPTFLSFYGAQKFFVAPKVNMSLGLSVGQYSGGEVLLASAAGPDPVAVKAISEYNGDKRIALGFFTAASFNVSKKSSIVLQYQPVFSISKYGYDGILNFAAKEAPNRLSALMLKYCIAIWQK